MASFMVTMRFYWHVDSKGLVHVQNWVGAYAGQHHVHTKKDFAKWRKTVAAGDLIHMRKATACDCGLKAGEVREGRAA
jgi:hypothetical protein